MYLEPLIICIVVIVAFGWWLGLREDKQNAKDEAAIARNDAGISQILQQGYQQDFRLLETENRRLAESNRQLDEANRRAQDALWTLLERAEARYKPYIELDWLVLSQRMDAVEFETLRADATDAKELYNFIAGALNYRVRPPLIHAS